MTWPWCEAWHKKWHPVQTCMIRKALDKVKQILIRGQRSTCQRVVIYVCCSHVAFHLNHGKPLPSPWICAPTPKHQRQAAGAGYSALSETFTDQHSALQMPNESERKGSIPCAAQSCRMGWINTCIETRGTVPHLEEVHAEERALLEVKCVRCAANEGGLQLP